MRRWWWLCRSAVPGNSRGTRGTSTSVALRPVPARSCAPALPRPCSGPEPTPNRAEPRRGEPRPSRAEAVSQFRRSAFVSLWVRAPRCAAPRRATPRQVAPRRATHHHVCYCKERRVDTAALPARMDPLTCQQTYDGAAGAGED